MYMFHMFMFGFCYVMLGWQTVISRMTRVE